MHCRVARLAPRHSPVAPRPPTVNSWHPTATHQAGSRPARALGLTSQPLIIREGASAPQANGRRGEGGLAAPQARVQGTATAPVAARWVWSRQMSTIAAATLDLDLGLTPEPLFMTVFTQVWTGLQPRSELRMETSLVSLGWQPWAHPCGLAVPCSPRQADRYHSDLSQPHAACSQAREAQL